MDDMIKVMVDAREFNWGRKKYDKACDVDTGGWELVHRGEAEVRVVLQCVLQCVL